MKHFHARMIYREVFFQVLAFLLTTVVAVHNGPDFFPYSKLNQNYIENNGEDNGIINGLLTRESMAALVLKWDGEILQSFCICTRASAKSFANIIHVPKKLHSP